MKSIIKKIGLALGVICFAGTLNFSNVLANEEINDMGTKVTTNTNKVWNVNFRSEVDVSSLKDSVHIKDLTNNSEVDVTLTDGDDESSAKINPPSSGYTVGHEYKITIDKKARSKKGKNLARVAALKFKVESKGTSNYNFNANVEVAQALPMFKKIKINETNLPSAVKYKIEGNPNVFNIGKAMASLVPDDEVKVYIYDAKGNVLATGMLDVSSNKNNINVGLTIN